jgi:hypothetical protein
VKLWCLEPAKNQQFTEKTARRHRNCETVKRFKDIKINYLHAPIPSLTETVRP